MNPAITVSGRVAARLTVDAAAMRRLPSVTDDAATVADGAVGSAVRVADLLGAATPDADASHCTVIGDGGAYRASIPLEDLTRGGWIAFGLGEGPLPVDRGGPFRLTVAAGDTLCWNVKRVESLVVTVGAEPDDVPANPPH